jgi:uncharacterized membrane protein YccC
MNSTSSSAVQPAILPFGSLQWFKRELAPTHLREIRTAIMVCGAVLCVIISMALQVPELSLSAYMVFFISKETKFLTTITGVIGLIGATIGIGASLVLYKFTYGHPELRIPGMAIALFLGMYLSRVFVIGPLGFLIGFVVAALQSIGEEVSSPEQLVRDILWIWVALAYGVGLTVVLNLLFLPDTPGPRAHLPKPKSFFVSDAFTNPAHAHFALKVTFATMFCYIFYMAIDWFGIHTALITCTFIALESTGATLHKGVLRIGGCIIGGALALFTIVFLMPHMVTIASLVVVVACASAIAGWVATGTELISYAGLQVAFAFFYSVFQGYAPDTDLDNVRNRVIGILFGLIVTGLVFQYIWPERATDRLWQALRQSFDNIRLLLLSQRPGISTGDAKRAAETLVAETNGQLAQAERQADVAQFEFEESERTEASNPRALQILLQHARTIFKAATSLVSEAGWEEWLRQPAQIQSTENELRIAAATAIQAEPGSAGFTFKPDNLSRIVSQWKQTLADTTHSQSRAASISEIVSEVEQLRQVLSVKSDGFVQAESGSNARWP